MRIALFLYIYWGEQKHQNIHVLSEDIIFCSFSFSKLFYFSQKKSFYNGSIGWLPFINLLSFFTDSQRFCPKVFFGFLFVLFIGSARVWTEGFPLARQALFPLSRAFNPSLNSFKPIFLQLLTSTLASHYIFIFVPFLIV